MCIELIIAFSQQQVSPICSFCRAVTFFFPFGKKNYTKKIPPIFSSHHISALFFWQWLRSSAHFI